MNHKNLIFTYHFLERYVYRFQDNRLDVLLDRIEHSRKPTKQEFNRIKKTSDKAQKKRIFVHKDMVIVVIKNTLLTCWRLP